MTAGDCADDCVRLSVHDSGVAEILIDRPERHNAMTLAMYRRLLAHIDTCCHQPAVRAVLFKGAGGRTFISGTDIGHFKDFRTSAEGIAYEAFVEEVINAVERMAVPTIAVVDGWAVGGGLALATACDFRVASTGSNFGAPIAKTLSNTLSSRNIARLIAALGVPRVKRLLLLAEHLSAQDALQCGFVHSTCDSSELDELAHGLAHRLMQLSAVTQRAVKESMRRIVVEQRQEDHDLIGAVYTSGAFRDGVAKFLARA